VLSSRSTLILISVVIFIFLITTGTYTGHVSKLSLSSKPKQPAQVYGKYPEKQKIIGLVFYGRREFVEILDCYLMVYLPAPMLVDFD
jgi:hypothetical protein